MLDRIAALVVAAMTTVATLCVNETGRLGAHAVRRSSLLGYEVAGQTWEAQDAARALAFAAQVAIVETPARARGRLLKAPHKSLGRIAEVWIEGTLVEARLRELRSGPLAPYVEQNTRTPRGFAAGQRMVTVTYPAGFTVPAIGVVS